jgi:Uncharacterized protein conserved in bacteria (DUF2062)
MTQTTKPPQPSRLKTIWRERMLAAIVAQLTQGVTPQKIALTIALGITLGIFPILGATTLLCLGFGLCLKLNQPILQAVNYFVSALQLALIIIFVRIGEFIVRAQPVQLSIPGTFREFHESPAGFFREFGLTGLHAIIGWMLIAPGLVVILYFSLLPFLQKFVRGHRK